MKPHKHRSIPKREETHGYNGCVARRIDDVGTRCNPTAHGGVCFIAHCKCGAPRRTNSTGFGRTERGPWIEAPHEQG